VLCFVPLSDALQAIDWSRTSDGPSAGKLCTKTKVETRLSPEGAGGYGENRLRTSESDPVQI
jgi:hypothetical protein